MLKKYLVEGIKNITRSPWLSLTAVTVLTVSFFSVVFIVILSITSGFVVRNIDSLVSFPVIIKENVIESKLPDIENSLKNTQFVKSVEYFDKQKAKAAVDSKQLVFASNYLSQDKNYAFRFFLVSPLKSENYGQLLELVKNNEYREAFDSVVGDQSFVDRLLGFYSIANVSTLLMVLVFGLVSVLVMSNILRMTIYTKKTEIEILRLVGATNNYIRGPFMFQGIMYSILSSGIVVGLFVVLLLFNNSLLKDYICSGDNAKYTALILQLYFGLAVSFVVSVIGGGITVLVSLQRYLSI
jgi:cell division transport system permease protein